MNKITVTLDIDALYNHALTVAKQNNGSLESSGGVTPEELEVAWEGMKTLFFGNNDPFREAMDRAIQALQDAETYCNAGEDD